MKGILFIVVSNGIFGLTDALSKVLTGTYPPGEILFFRSVFVFVSIGVMVLAQGGWRRVRIVNWRSAEAECLQNAASGHQEKAPTMITVCRRTTAHLSRPFDSCGGRTNLG